MLRLPQSAIAGLVLIILACTSLAVAKEPKPAPPRPARTYPAHDEHTQEQVTIAVDPYDVRDKAEIFRTKWLENEILPVRLIISNDSNRTISLADMNVVLVTSRRAKLQPATPDDLYRRIARTTNRGDEPSRNPTPLPLPRKGPQVGVSKESQKEIHDFRFRALAVEPHAIQSGFLFFDVQGIKDALRDAHVYLTGIRDGTGQKLMYFEIDLNKYLEAASGNSGGGSQRQKP